MDEIHTLDSCCIASGWLQRQNTVMNEFLGTSVTGDNAVVSFLISVMQRLLVLLVQITKMLLKYSSLSGSTFYIQKYAIGTGAGYNRQYLGRSQRPTIVIKALV